MKNTGRPWQIAITGLALVALACTCGLFSPSGIDVGSAPVTSEPATISALATDNAAAYETLSAQVTQSSVPATSTATPTASPTATPAPPTLTPTITLTPTLTPTPDLITTEKTDEQLRVLFELWTTIHDVYVYDDFNGVDWEAIYGEYKPQVEAGLTSQAFYRLMQAMIDELGDEHSHFLSPEDVEASEIVAAADNDYVGIGVLIVAKLEINGLVVLSTFPNSPAAEAGLQPHDLILLANGEAVLDEEGYIRSELLRGPVGSVVTLQVQTPGQAPRELTITRREIPGGSPLYSRLMPTSDGNGILYLLITDFVDQTLPDRVEELLAGHTANGPLDGVIIDNRLNTGGYNSVLRKMLGFFTEGEQGYFVSRTGTSRPLTITPNGINGTQQVPLVVLVGERTASYGEIFSGVLQDSGRATLIGSVTDGNVETLHPYDFEDGSRAYIAQEGFQPRVSGADWERDGLIPDQIVEADWGEVSFDSDPVLFAALQVLGYN